MSKERPNKFSVIDFEVFEDSSRTKSSSLLPILALIALIMSLVAIVAVIAAFLLVSGHQADIDATLVAIQSQPTVTPQPIPTGVTPPPSATATFMSSTPTPGIPTASPTPTIPSATPESSAESTAEPAGLFTEEVATEPLAASGTAGSEQMPEVTSPANPEATAESSAAGGDQTPEASLEVSDASPELTAEATAESTSVKSGQIPEATVDTPLSNLIGLSAIIRVDNAAPIYSGNAQAYLVEIQRVDASAADTIALNVSQGMLFSAAGGVHNIDCAEQTSGVAAQSVEMPVDLRILVIAYCAPQVLGANTVRLTAATTGADTRASSVTQDFEVMMETVKLDVTQIETALTDEPEPCTGDETAWESPEGSEYIPFTVTWSPGADAMLPARRYGVSLEWVDENSRFSLQYTTRDCESAQPLNSGAILPFEPGYSYVMRLYIAKPEGGSFADIPLPQITFNNPAIMIDINDTGETGYQVLPLIRVNLNEQQALYVFTDLDVNSQPLSTTGTLLGDWYVGRYAQKDAVENTWVQVFVPTIDSSAAPEAGWIQPSRANYYKVIGNLDGLTEPPPAPQTEGESAPSG